MYRPLRFINPLASAPISGTDNANDASTIRESHCEHAAAGLTETEKPGFTLTVRKISGDYTLRIEEGKLRVGKCYAMLALILSVFGRIPLEAWVHDRKYRRDMGLAPYGNMGGS